MSNIVAKSDFVDEISIPNDSQGFGGNADSLTRFIMKYEPRFLAMLMGSDFATLFINGLFPQVTDPVTPVEQRWTDLNTADLRIAAANYVYYYWMRNDNSQTLGVGNVKTKNTNADIYTAADKCCRAWREMNVISWQVVRFLKDNAITYPEYKVPVWACNYRWDEWEFGSDYFWQFRRVCKMPDILYPLSRL